MITVLEITSEYMYISPENGPQIYHNQTFNPCVQDKRSKSGEELTTPIHLPPGIRATGGNAKAMSFTPQDLYT